MKYNNVDFLTLPQQVGKNKQDILDIQNDIEDVSVGPQGEEGPRGAQGVQGIDGPAGPDGTPVPGTEADSEIDVTNGGNSIELRGLLTSSDEKRFFVRDLQFATTDSNGLNLYVDDVLQIDKISILDSMLVITAFNELRIMFYNENGELTQYLNIGVTATLKINSLKTFGISELLEGSTVGPNGPAGAQGAQGVNGPAGAQGAQGLPGEQNLRFLATFEDADTFPEYSYRVMVQCIGGDYDGITFIKETMDEGATCKHGAYATFVSIEDNGGTIQSILLSGVTSIRVYAVENIS